MTKIGFSNVAARTEHYVDKRGAVVKSVVPDAGNSCR
jgi:hypothetical protein